MSYPQIISKFASKKPCKHCGSEPYKKGTMIYKINEEYWCCNIKCPQPKQDEKAMIPHPEITKSSLSPATNIPTTTSTRVPQAKIDYSDHAWDIALAKSKSIYAHDPNILQRDIMILAQVFYKSYMGIA